MEDAQMMGAVTIIVALLGLLIGGCVGVHLEHGFSPDCWWGALIGAGCVLGVCGADAIGDVDW